MTDHMRPPSATGLSGGGREPLRFSRDPRTMNAAEVWAEALADPKFVAALDAGLADLVAGRKYSLDTETGKLTPNPDWPAEGPQP